MRPAPGYCFGCLTYKDDDGDYCEYCVHNNVSEGLCPCSICIVKTMCNEGCDDFGKWTNSEGVNKSFLPHNI